MEDIHTDFIIETTDNKENEDLSVSELARLFPINGDNEKTTDLSPENQWKTLVTQALNRCAKFVYKIIVFFSETNEVEKTHSFTSSFLRKSMRWNDIRQNKDKQDIFILGYVHAINQILELLIQHKPNKEDEKLFNVIKTYKYIGPCVLALNTEFQLSHTGLAQRVNLSKASLSNFMSRVSSYNIFDTTVIGRNRYYSLAQPNGQKIVSFIKKAQAPTIERDTLALTSVMDYLVQISRDKQDSETTFDTCRNLVQHTTTTPNIILKQIAELTAKLTSPRYPIDYLKQREREVSNVVFIFSIDICNFEKMLAKEIVDNITRKEINYFYIVPAGEKSVAQKYLKKYITSHLDYSKSKSMELVEQKINVMDINKETLNINIDDISVIVVYDLKNVYYTEDKSIDEHTLYDEANNEKKEAILNVCSYITNNIHPSKF